MQATGIAKVVRQEPSEGAFLQRPLFSLPSFS